eukprot:CAMPEP_0170581476 /NCGR_PEP_ID=MMETSP0224-20130122/7058_1 /TAXON_ID=285029 /ORGANISM="Togula jolla, Strain CCCM 725" /LENGTH=79 /DNA_ID=CAMNT_0010904611 /DNA_START=128 /DNA_END=363 /DNA_ORIENTATION=+
MTQTMKFCKRFKSLKNQATVDQAMESLLRKVEVSDGAGNIRRRKRCRDFEAAQLINLMPGSVEEARVLIPTLEGNTHLG